ncbi:unnamed protein product [Closterium sp. Naga37s-1]|nr:unnamed protein product [Closterium sp. Naga37s-1]CAI5503509.1 unnamed protein product [Closterium sp. Naga37s-1]
MIRWPLSADSSLFPSPVPSAYPLWPPAPALPLAPAFRPPFCPLGDFRLTRTASPSILPTLPPVPTVAAAAACAPPAPPICSPRATAALLATATRRPPFGSAAGGALVRAFPLRKPLSARGANRASETRCPRLIPPFVTARLATFRRAPAAAAPATLVLAPVMQAELTHAPCAMTLTPFRRARPLCPSSTVRSGRLCIASAYVRSPSVLPPESLRVVSLPAAAVLTAQ